MPKPRRVTFTLDAWQHREAWIRAHYNCLEISPAMRQAAFDLWKKYAIPEAQRARLELEYEKATGGPKAVQPEGLGLE
jgi:hypothetical protein